MIINRGRCPNESSASTGYPGALFWHRLKFRVRPILVAPSLHSDSPPMRHCWPALLGSLCIVLSGCSAFTPTALPKAPSQPPVSEKWQAPLAHGGSVTALSSWWERVGDDTLPALITLAQEASPTLSAAATRVEEARLQQVVGLAALGPSLDASAAANRGNTQYPLPLSRTTSGAIAASWEADLFGAQKLAVKAAEARAASAQAQWHDARVVVAAETAVRYLSLRYCEAVRTEIEQDLSSADTLGKLARLGSDAGLLANSLADQARAQQAAVRASLLGQQSACDLEVKALVALTALPEPELRTRLAREAGRPLDVPPALAIQKLPAQVVAQRPDVYAAERDIIAAASEVGETQALRLPRLSIGGSIGVFSVRGGPLAADLNTWSIGPLRLQVPLYDGGIRQAQVKAAEARFDSAVRVYEARVRQAVREVEEALVQSHFNAERLAQVRSARQALERSLNAAERRTVAGLASRQALEEARRQLIAVRINELALIREGLIAGVSLYRAAGGGWDTP
ncbi:MAG: efflux transporter outer membrane subunit [Betaproteobacteria bacterium]|nr:efflux transporter outer membrane subunit [Betaproteobacteria bacterium]